MMLEPRLACGTRLRECVSEQCRTTIFRGARLGNRGAKGNSMKPRLLTAAVLLLVALAAAACTIGQAPPPSDPVQAAATIVAQTLSAQGITLAPAQVSTVASPSPQPATPTATQKPSLKINVDGTECRSGTEPDADLIATFSANTDVDLIARNTADGFWMVKDPSSGSSCWVTAASASPSGNFGQLPEITPQPLVANEAPAAPSWTASSTAWQYSCAPGLVSVTLQWTDRADNEQGYRVYRNGTLIAELAAGSTVYSDQVNAAGGSFNYSIRSYNGIGESGPLNTGNFSC
jgi:hypothetical protein